VDSLDPTAPAVPPFRRPADYYSSPADTLRPIFPKWMPFGCGIASLVVIAAMVLMAAGISSGAFNDLFGFVLTSMESEVVKMMATDVKPQQKVAFKAEMKTLRDSISSGKTTMDKLQPLMKSIRDVSIDERVTGPEIERLTREVHALNAPRK
jgi:hypothetical protein